MAIKLYILTPLFNKGDLVINCELDWSVRKVKEEIEKVFVNHPKVEDQRLVYSGKLLDDESLMQHILRLETEADSYTMHLACKNTTSQNKQKTNQSNQSIYNTGNQSTTTTAPVNNTNQNNASPNPNFDSSTWMNYLQHYSQYSQYSQSISNASNNGQQPGAEQNAAVLQQQMMYAQYMAQYMQYIQNINNATATGQLIPVQSQITPQHTSVPPQFIPQADAPVVEPDAPEINQENQVNQMNPANQVNQDNNNPVLNAAGGAFGAAAVDDEDIGGQRDMLDWIYVLSRLLLLFSIVYFYSTFTRFAMVTGFALLAYLWNAGFFRRLLALQRGREARVIQEQVDRVRQAQNNLQEAEANGNETNDTDDVNEGNNAANEGNHNHEEDSAIPEQYQPRLNDRARQSFVEVAGTFVYTFFTSLFPEQAVI